MPFGTLQSKKKALTKYKKRRHHKQLMEHSKEIGFLTIPLQ